MVSNIGYLISVQGVISRDCLADCPQSPLHRRRSRVEALVGVFADALADVLLAALTRSVEHCRSALEEIVVEIVVETVVEIRHRVRLSSWQPAAILLANLILQDGLTLRGDPILTNQR